MSALHWLLALGPVLILSAPLHAQPKASRPGQVSGSVSVVHEGRPRPERSVVVVSIEGVPGDEPTPMRASIRQRQRTFEPAMLVVTRGSTIDFPNEDKIFHNVFSLSRAARFDLDLYKSGTSKSVTMRRAGVVDVHCNIHPEMVAKIKVLDTSYFATAAADGTFRIGNVPPGTYTLVAWHASGGEERRQVTVTSGTTTTMELEIEEQARPTMHRRKDGTPYGRYR